MRHGHLFQADVDTCVHLPEFLYCSFQNFKKKNIYIETQQRVDPIVSRTVPSCVGAMSIVASHRKAASGGRAGVRRMTVMSLRFWIVLHLEYDILDKRHRMVRSQIDG